MSLAPGTVVGLDGHANLIDHHERWRSLPLFPRAVYLIGDLNCHQIASRSWMVGGNQVPVDVRMFAGFLLGNAGFALALALPATHSYKDTAAAVWPRRLRQRLDSPGRRQAALAMLWVAALAPATIDVVVQMGSSYESSNFSRFWTGGLLGVLGGFLIGALLRCLMEPAPGSATVDAR